MEWGNTLLSYDTYDIISYAMLKCVHCEINMISHSGIVCDITPLQNFFFDITPVLSKATPPTKNLCHVPSLLVPGTQKANGGAQPMLCSSLIQLLVESVHGA